MIDHVVQAVCSRFDEDGYKTLSRLESYSVMRKQTWMTLMICFVYMTVITKVGWQHSYVFYTAISEKNNTNEISGMKLKSIINFLQCLSPAECQFYSMVMQLFKLILVTPATSVNSDVLKTWLRSTMHQSRLNWCMLLHMHCEDTDKHGLTALAHEFIGRNASHHSIFGNLV